MYFEDNTNYSHYLNTPIDVVWNVGWLERGKEYSKGKVDTDILSKFASILTATGNVDVHINRMRSLDSCALSGCNGIVVACQSMSVDLGGSEIWLPSVKKGEYFACPSLVYHYIQEHDYQPPAEFLMAIESFDLKVTYKAQVVYLELVKDHF